MITRRTRFDSVPLDFFAKAPKEVVAEAKALANGGKVTRAAIVDALEAAKQSNDTARAESLFTLLVGAQKGASGATATPELWKEISGDAPAREAKGLVTQPGDDQLDQATTDFRSSLDNFVVGQERAKDDLSLFYRVIKGKKNQKKPFSMLISGPSGVGKSELARGLSYALHGNPDRFMTVDGTLMPNMPGFGKYFGMGPGYVGSDGEPRLSPARFQSMFGSDKPIIILFDEIDKIGKDDPKAKDLFWDKLNKALENGSLVLENGEELDLRGAIFLFTSNAGADTAQGLTGEALMKHYLSATEKEIGRDHSIGRLDQITAADPLDAKASGTIAKMMMDKLCKELVAETKEERGIDIHLEVEEGVADLLGDLAVSPRFGARPLKKMIEQLVEPVLRDEVDETVDEGRYTLRLEPRKIQAFYEIDDSNVAWARMKATFQKQLPGVASEFKAKGSFPIRFVTKSEPPRFVPYPGQVPNSGVGTMITLGAGEVGGDGYFLADLNGKEPKNQFFMLRERASLEADNYVEIELPEKLAEANYVLSSTKFSENELFFYGVNAPEGGSDGDEGEAFAYIYNHAARRQGAQAFTPVSTPPVPLVDAQIVAIDQDRILVTGGRVLVNEEGEWFPNLDPSMNNGAPVESTSWVFDRNTSTWSPLSDISSADAEGLSPQVPRVGAATVRVGDEIWFIGGEEQKSLGNNTRTSQSSNLVDIFDTKTLSFRPGPKLPTKTAYASAFVDETGGIRVMGGTGRLLAGTEMEPIDIHLRIDPAAKEPTWKFNPNLTTPAAAPLVIPHVQGFVVGPFYDDSSFEPRFELLHSRGEE